MSKDLGSLKNKIFIQCGTIGIASYHFMIGQPYVNYENCSDWGLDDRSPMPKKKFFENWSFDQETRTF